MLSQEQGIPVPVPALASGTLPSYCVTISTVTLGKGPHHLCPQIRASGPRVFCQPAPSEVPGNKAGCQHAQIYVPGRGLVDPNSAITQQSDSRSFYLPIHLHSFLNLAFQTLRQGTLLSLGVCALKPFIMKDTHPNLSNMHSRNTIMDLWLALLTSIYKGQAHPEAFVNCQDSHLSTLSCQQRLLCFNRTPMLETLFLM